MTTKRNWLLVLDSHAFRLLRNSGGIWFAILATLALLSLALGTLGCHQVAVGQQRGGSLVDEFYQALQLFVLTLPPVTGEIPLTLDLARYLAAFVSFSAAIGLLGKFFPHHIQAFRLEVLGRRHVVVCGLGEIGADLVEDLRRNHHFVVVIEANPNHLGLARCRDLGAIVLIGSSADTSRLRIAQIGRAAVVLAILGGDDRLNIETGVLTFDLRPKVKTVPMTFLLQVSDPDLLTVVRRHPMARDPSGRFNLQFFNGPEVCARAMLRRALILLQGVEPDHILVVGLGGGNLLSETLILRAAKDRALDHGRHAPKLQISVHDAQATSALACLRRRHPFLDDVCIFQPINATTQDLTLDQAAQPNSLPPAPDVAFVCFDHEAKALVAADQLRAHLPSTVPIVIRTARRNAGLGALIPSQAPARMVNVGTEDQVFRLAATLQPVQELIARAVHHEYYMYQTRTINPNREELPGVKLWEDLAVEYKDSSRAQAADFPRKLGLLGYQMIYCPDALIVPVEFSTEEVEALARDEHERWCRNRGEQGWTYGITRDNGRNRHPHLIPWDDPRLAKATRDIDRNAMRRLPAALAHADYRIDTS